MQVGTANGCGGDAHDGIVWIQYFRIRNFLNANVLFTVPAKCSHKKFGLPAGRWRSQVYLSLPRGWPSVVGTSPVSSRLLRRNKSSEISASASSPKSLA